MNIRVGIFCLALFALGISCRDGFLIHVSQLAGRSPEMRFEQLGIFGTNTIDIKQLQVGRVIAQGKPVELVWAIQRKLERTSPIATIEYGAVPLDFEESILARPLIAGEVYDVLASSPGAIGGVRFTKK